MEQLNQNLRLRSYGEQVRVEELGGIG
jgi:hypothetical protein